MSISSRISSMEEHVTNAYNGLQGLGADLTGIDKNIDNIAQVLDDIYDDLPKVTGSGTSITLDDTRKGRLESTLSGNTSQYTTTGKNFYSTSMLPITEYGITISKNANGDIVLNGTPNFSEGYKTFYTGDVITVEAGTYTLSVANKIAGIGCVVGGFNGGCNLTLNDTVTSKSAYADTPQNVNPAINIRYDVGTLTNFVLNPQMEKSSSATTYEPYTNGVSPNPDYPQDIHVVSGDNEINVCGKNLLDIDTLNYKPNNYTITKTNNNYTYTVSSSGTWWQAPNYKVLNIEPNTQYTYSFNVSGLSITSGKNSRILIDPIDSNGEVISMSGANHFIDANSIGAYSKTFTTPANTRGFLVRVYVEYSASTANTYVTLNNFMIEKSSSVSSYLHYSKDTYNIDLPVENLFPEFSIADRTQSGLEIKRNSDNTLLIKGTSTAVVNNWINNLNISLNSGTYTFSTNYDLGGKVTIVLKDNNSQNIAQFNSGKSATFSINETTIFNQMLVQVASDVTIDNSFTFQLELGSKANTYTPYGTTPIELCKIGNYQDYFYKDSDKWYLHKEIGKVILNGSEYWNYYTDTSKPVFWIDPTTGTNIFNYLQESGLICYCDYFQGKGQVASFDDAYNLGNNVIAFRTSYKRLVIRDDRYTSTEDFKNWLSSNNVVVYYVLATPVNIPLEDM